jgi:hypothetical protein
VSISTVAGRRQRATPLAGCARKLRLKAQGTFMKMTRFASQRAVRTARSIMSGVTFDRSPPACTDWSVRPSAAALSALHWVITVPDVS